MAHREVIAHKALNKEFDKWLDDGSGGRKSELDIEWLTDVETEDSYKWRWIYEGRNYTWEYNYETKKIDKIIF